MLVFAAAIEERQRAVGGVVAPVPPRAVRPGLAGRGAADRLEDVEHARRSALAGRDAELADEAGAVAGVLQQRWIADRHVRVGERRRAEGEAVRALVLAGQDRRARRRADRRGDEGVVEAHALGGQRFEVRGAQASVADAAQAVPALVVGDDDEQVGEPLRRRVGRDCAGRGEGGERDGDEHGEAAQHRRTITARCAVTLPGTGSQRLARRQRWPTRAEEPATAGSSWRAPLERSPHRCGCAKGTPLLQRRRQPPRHRTGCTAIGTSSSDGVSASTLNSPRKRRPASVVNSSVQRPTASVGA